MRASFLLTIHSISLWQAAACHVCLDETEISYSCDECFRDECAHCAVQTASAHWPGERFRLLNTCEHKLGATLKQQSARTFPGLISDTDNNDCSGPQERLIRHRYKNTRYKSSATSFTSSRCMAIGPRKPSGISSPGSPVIISQRGILRRHSCPKS